MKKVLLFLLIILISNVSAIIINEVETNSVGGGEWVELYNDGEDVNISGWEVWEGMVSGLVNPKKILIIPEGTILQAKGYFIIEFSKKLNNDGDYVILKDSFGNEIDKTDIFKEISSSDKTWQLCNGEFIFEIATKGDKNNCEETEENIQEEEPEETEENILEDEVAEGDELTNEEESSIVKISSKEIQERTEEEVKTIILTPKGIKSEIDKEQLSKNKLAIYGLVVFCILLVFLFIFKKGKKEKNEFR